MRDIDVASSAFELFCCKRCYARGTSLSNCYRSASLKLFYKAIISRGVKEALLSIERLVLSSVKRPLSKEMELELAKLISQGLFSRFSPIFPLPVPNRRRSTK